MKGVTGYVLAGGRSSRMGQDKATMLLEERPLVERAVTKLQSVAGEARIVGTRPDLVRYAEIVPDLRESCGPLGGAEAALLNSSTDWVLLMAVDMPFVPTGLLRWLIEGVQAREFVRAAVCMVDGSPEPTVCLLHQEMAPLLSESLDESRLRFFPAIKTAAEKLAQRAGRPADEAFWLPDGVEASIERRVTAVEWQTRQYWFANLNTPEEFAMAQRGLDSRD